MTVTYRIGEASAQTGASVDTIRYYERIGMLPAPSRSESGRRLYTSDEIGRLLFIRRAKLLGFSLDEIRGLLGVAEQGDCRPLRRRVAELIEEKIVWCEARIAEMQSFRDELGARREAALDHADAPACDCASFPATCACVPVDATEISTGRR